MNDRRRAVILQPGVAQKPNVGLAHFQTVASSSSYEHEYYLDIETGEILFISEYMDDEETGKLKDQMEEDFDRYERIPRAESHEG